MIAKSLRAKLALIVLVIFASLAIWCFFIEPSRLVLHEEPIVMKTWPRSLDGLRIALIADIHAGSPFIDDAKLHLVVQKTNDSKPDMIVLLGDFVQRSWFSKRFAPEAVADVLKDLQAPLGVYAVMGNHDWRYDIGRVRSSFENVGIRVMDNDVLRLQKNGQAFWLVGWTDAWTGENDIASTSQRIQTGEPAIAITHNPDLFPQIPFNVQILLAAHTHGGQVNLPFLGRLIVPSEYGQRYAAGHVEENGKHLFVTTGIGTSVFPIRFRVPPEIAVVTLRSAQ